MYTPTAAFPVSEGQRDEEAADQPAHFTCSGG
jgi:hypothetical protein